MSGRAVSTADHVKIVDGPFKGYRGMVKHIVRRFVFVRSHQHSSDGGIICVNGKQVSLAGKYSKRRRSNVAVIIIVHYNSCNYRQNYFY